ncbi:hypothetical protein RQP46_007560 [Phenoliferia psychrophenolica]
MSTPVARELQSEVLSEYARMASNLDTMSKLAQQLASAQPPILEQLRPLERKMGLVLTLYQASVWAILVQRQEQDDDDLLNNRR